MKTKRHILSTLAAALVGPVLILAQSPPPPPHAPETAPPLPDADQIAASAVAVANDAVRSQMDRVNVEVQKQLTHAHQAVQLAQLSTGYSSGEMGGMSAVPPEAPEPPMAMIGHAPDFGSKAGADPLVILAEKPDEAQLVESQEDLNIMSRILAKTIGRTGEDRSDPFALGIKISSFSTSRQPRALYLEGYGAVFTTAVSFPLTPSASPPEKPEGKTANTTWEQTKQELYGGAPKHPGSGMNEEMMLRYGLMLPASPKREQPYDPDRVERLKGELIDALKNASNLRHVKPDEQIVVAVSSGDGSTKEVQTVNIVRKGRGVATAVSTNESEKSGTPGNTLVVRAKKSDVDDFAAGKLDRAGFTERVKIALY